MIKNNGFFILWAEILSIQFVNLIFYLFHLLLCLIVSVSNKLEFRTPLSLKYNCKHYSAQLTKLNKT
jgi:hypothetical protein